jgi:hypothetical protein
MPLKLKVVKGSKGFVLEVSENPTHKRGKVHKS